MHQQPPSEKATLSSTDSISSVRIKHRINSNSQCNESLNSFASEYSLDDFDNGRKSFKEKKTYHQRVAESRNIKSRFPNKIPVIVEKHPKEKNLPPLDKSKYLVPQELNMSQFVVILRSRMHLGHNQALYLLVNNKHIVSMSANVAQIYNEFRDEDGFLYLSYASQEVFGG